MTSPTPSTTGNTLREEILKQIPQAHCTNDCDGNGTYSDTDMPNLTPDEQEGFRRAMVMVVSILEQANKV